MTKKKAALSDASQEKLLSFCFSGTDATAASDQRVTAVNLHFRREAWILDANCCDLVREGSSNVHEVIRHEKQTLGHVQRYYSCLLCQMNVPFVCYVPF